MNRKDEFMQNKKKSTFIMKLGDFIADFRYFFLGLFLCFTIFCLFNINKVTINENITNYLPDDTETKYGLDLMEQEFGNTQTVQLMIENISLEKATEMSLNLEEISQVKKVLFDKNTAYKNEKALYMIQIDDLKKDQLEKVIDEIKTTVGKEQYSLYSEALEDTTDGIGVALLLSVVVIMIILIITSKTYFEPIIAIIIFGISILLNMGTNFLLGEISYITKSIAVILQLALSIDYVIIFMNQFMKEIDDTSDSLLAVKKTISKATPEIFASSLTTISGLLALLFMQLKIGGDIGIVLSKGILCSLLTVICVMPSLLMIFLKFILKLRKKERASKTSKLGSFILKQRKILLSGFVFFVVISVMMISKYHYVYDANSAHSFRLSENKEALEKIEKTWGETHTIAILVENQEKDYTKELELANQLMELDSLTSVTNLGNYEIEGYHLGSKVNYLEFMKSFQLNEEMSLGLFQAYAKDHNQLDQLVNLEEYRISLIDLFEFLQKQLETLPLSNEMKNKIEILSKKLEEAKPLLESDQYSRMILTISAPIESEETYQVIDSIRNITKDYYDAVTIVGNTINARDLEQSFTSDNLIITAVTIGFIGIILLFTFKSVILSLMLIITIEGSVLINFALVSLLGKEIFFMAYVVVSAIQMGATIDYAIVITSRYRQLRNKMNTKEAIEKALNDSLPAVITSGLILLIAGFLIGFISTSSVISEIGLFLGIGTFVSLIATIFVLPAILHLFDKIIVKKNSYKKR